MSKAVLKNDRGQERDYQINGNALITLKIDDFANEITFFDSNDNKLDGEFVFVDEDEYSDNYLLARMYAPAKFKKSGLGRAAIEFFKDYMSTSVYARENDGHRRNDGSHLTEDAPGFVSQMIAEGLILNPNIKDSEYD